MKIFDLFKKKKEIPMVQLEVVGKIKFDNEYSLDIDYTSSAYHKINVIYSVEASINNNDSKQTPIKLDERFSICYDYYYSNDTERNEKIKEMHDDILEFIIVKGERGRVRKSLEKNIITELKRKIAENKIDDFKELINGKSFNLNISFECNKDDLELK